MAVPEILVRARNAFKMGEYSLVERLAMKMLEDQPESAVAFNLLGSVCEKTGRFRRAIDLFQRAVELKPDYAEAHNNLGVIFKRIESLGEAIPCFEKAIALAPGRGDVYYNLGNVYKALGNEDLAVENFEKAIAVDPGYVPSYINLGTALEARGRLGDAIRVYQKGLQADSSQPRLHYNLGVVYERLGRLGEAREEYDAALKARPGWADALNNLGVVVHRLGDAHGAERLLRDALRAEPGNARALNNLGVVLAALGRPDDAARAYRDALKSNARYAQAAENLSALLEQEGKLSEALEELRRLLSLEPGNTAARLRSAGILRLLENWSASIAEYEAVLAAQPGHEDALKGLALACARAGDRGRALECYAQLEARGGPDADFRLDRALLWKDAGQIEKAREEVVRHLAEVPDDRRARVLLADIHQKQGHLRQAAQTLIEVLEVAPGETEASSRLAKLYRQLGEPQKAIETLEVLINRLEQGGDEKGMDVLSDAMEEYEQAIAEHEKDFREERERAIRRLREVAMESAPPERAAPAEDPMLIEDAEPLVEDAVPIINVGGIEPAFTVREEDEELRLEEVDETVHDEEVAIEDERPPNLVNLLKDQELYEENPALQMFEPPPPLPSQQPRAPQPPAPPPPSAPPAPAAPPQAAQLTLSPQGESVLANSLKEAVAAQSKVVDKLFDEMRDLARKIDEKRVPPPSPPILLTMPPAGGPPPLRPVVMDLSAAGQPDGFPRWTAGDAAEEEAVAEHEALAGARAAKPRVPEGDVTLEEVPEPLEDPGAPASAAAAPEAPPGPGQAAEGSLEEEAELEPVEDEAPLPGPRRDAGPAATPGQEPPPPRSGEDVRRDLRSYLDGVREKLDKVPPKPSGPADLLDYLGKLSEYLPERERRRFRGSKERLAMEAIKAALAGKQGLRHRMAESFPPPPRRKGPMTRSLVVDTFAYLKDLAGWHPDRAVGAAMKESIDSIVSRMGGAG